MPGASQHAVSCALNMHSHATADVWCPSVVLHPDPSFTFTGKVFETCYGGMTHDPAALLATLNQPWTPLGTYMWSLPIAHPCSRPQPSGSDLPLLFSRLKGPYLLYCSRLSIFAQLLVSLRSEVSSMVQTLHRVTSQTITAAGLSVLADPEIYAPSGCCDSLLARGVFDSAQSVRPITVAQAVLHLGELGRQQPFACWLTGRVRENPRRPPPGDQDDVVDQLWSESPRPSSGLSRPVRSLVLASHPMARKQNLLAASALLVVLVSCHHALALRHTGSRRLQDNSAAVAASGNAQAIATTNGQTIVANGGPGCSTTATLGSNAYAFATGPPCGGKCADIVVGWGQVCRQRNPELAQAVTSL